MLLMYLEILTGKERGIQMNHNSTETHALSEKKKKAILNRIAKIIGHTKSTRRMVENGRDCSEVLIQMSAIKAAINNTGKEILKEYLQMSLMESIENNDPESLEKIQKAMESFVK